MDTDLLILVLTSSNKATPRKQREGITYRGAALSKFVARRVRNHDYAGIVADSASRVEGLLLGGLREDDIENLDFYTGSQFVRRKVRVKYFDEETPSHDTISGDSGTLQQISLVEQWADTETYVWKDRTTLGTEKWDFEYFQRQKLDAFIADISLTWSLSAPPTAGGVGGGSQPNCASQTGSGRDGSSSRNIGGNQGPGPGGDQIGRDVKSGLGPGARLGRGSGMCGGSGSSTPGAGVSSANAGQGGGGLRGGWWARTNANTVQGTNSNAARGTSGGLLKASSDPGPRSSGGGRGTDESDRRQCKACGKTVRLDEKLFRCARCRVVTYCSVGCQRADWADHERTCDGRLT